MLGIVGQGQDVARLALEDLTRDRPEDAIPDLQLGAEDRMVMNSVRELCRWGGMYPPAGTSIMSIRVSSEP